MHGVAEGGITQHDVLANSGCERVVEQRQGMFPLRRELDLVGHSNATASLAVPRPDLRQVEPHSDTAAAALPSQVQAGSDLAVINSPERPRVLAGDADGVAALLRETCVVDNERLDLGQLTIQRAPKASEDFGLRP
ncbi:MAG TPA: hypothetical protein VK427_22615 [Kofleriaceae bacterium]|nr:hypothetical protein [Kofleriaceae bacterium]